MGKRKLTNMSNNHPTPTRHDGVFESERAGKTPPVTHNSGTMRTTPAGGEVSPSQYWKPVPPKNGGPGK
jgi:hypothetical protein